VVEHRRIIDLLAAAFGATQLGKLRREQIIEYYEQLRRDGLAAATIRRRHVVLRAALEYAVLLGWLVSNPASGRGIVPSASRARLHPPSPTELATILADANRCCEGFEAFLRLTAHSGARRGEVCATRWSDLDLDRGVASLSRALSIGRGAPVERRTKTDRTRRFSLGPQTVAVLHAHRKAMQARCERFGQTLDADAFVFSDAPDCSRPWRPEKATAEFIRLRNKVGLPSVRLHDLRHYVATQLLAAGVDVVTVAGRLGHANPSTTLNVYADFVPPADRAAANLLESLLPD
jgi:integrase